MLPPFRGLGRGTKPNGVPAGPQPVVPNEMPFQPVSRRPIEIKTATKNAVFEGADCNAFVALPLLK